MKRQRFRPRYYFPFGNVLEGGSATPDSPGSLEGRGEVRDIFYKKYISIYISWAWRIIENFQYQGQLWGRLSVQNSTQGAGWANEMLLHNNTKWIAQLVYREGDKCARTKPDTTLTKYNTVLIQILGPRFPGSFLERSDELDQNGYLESEAVGRPNHIGVDKFNDKTAEFMAEEYKSLKEMWTVETSITWSHDQRPGILRCTCL